MNHIKNTNAFIYGDYGSGKKQQIREELGISNNVEYEYDSKNKYIYSLKNNNFHEYILLKGVKQNEIQRIIKSYMEISTNKQFSGKKMYFILYNIQFVEQLSFIKVLIEKTYHNYIFIFTCNKFNMYLSQFCLPVKCNQYIYKHFKELDIDNILYNQCNKIITNIFNKKIKNIRDDLYFLLLKYFHFNEIIKELLNCAINYNHHNIDKCSIIKYAAQCEYESLHGNKEIFFLEKFLLLLIDNEQ